MMKKINTRIVIKCIIALILSMSITINVSSISYNYDGNSIVLKSNDIKHTEEEIEEFDDWQNVDLNSNFNESEISNTFTPKLVCENNDYTFWYDTTGADIYIRDKRNGHIWSNTVNDDYYDNEKAPKSNRTQLLQISIVDEEGATTILSLCDAIGDKSKFNITDKYTDEGLVLNIEVIKFFISFDVVFKLNDQGFSVTIPSDSIKQNKDNKIVSITLMPYFGAARIDMDGYILVPDGCGALINFENKEAKDERVYTYSIYGQSEQDMNKLLSRDIQDIKNIMLPVFGIKNHKNGFLSAVTEGAENTSLNVVPYGYQCPKLGRAYYTFTYLYTERISINGKSINQVMHNMELSNRKVEYFLLDNNCSYSDMAAVYRKHLEKENILKEKIESNYRGISLDIFMGVIKDGMFFKDFVDMTNFNDVENMVKDLKNNGVNELELTLQGWNKGGFTAYPTDDKVSSKLGGKRKLNNLLDWLNSNDVTTFLYNDFYQADTGSKNVNIRKDIIRDYVGNMIIDINNKTVMLNISSSLERYITKAKETKLYNNAGFSLARAGQWLWNSHEKDYENTRTKTVNTCVEVLKQCNNNPLQVYGGNQYVLPYSDFLREIPDTTSKYYYESVEVPFYQLVVNGYIKYTSVAGNMAYDAQYQKLKWIEFGSTPYYIITQNSSLDLVGTQYDKLFSSEYTTWKDSIIAVNDEFNNQLSAINGAEMVSHTIISDKVFLVKYSNDVEIYINYSNDTVNVENIIIEGMDYTVVQKQEGRADK